MEKCVLLINLIPFLTRMTLIRRKPLHKVYTYVHIHKSKRPPAQVAWKATASRFFKELQKWSEVNRK